MNCIKNKILSNNIPVDFNHRRIEKIIYHIFSEKYKNVDGFIKIEPRTIDFFFELFKNNNLKSGPVTIYFLVYCHGTFELVDFLLSKNDFKHYLVDYNNANGILDSYPLHTICKLRKYSSLKLDSLVIKYSLDRDESFREYVKNKHKQLFKITDSKNIISFCENYFNKYINK